MSWCWLASLPDRNRFAGTRCRINAQALCSETRAGLRELDPTLEHKLAGNGLDQSFAHALVKVTAFKRYTPLVVLNRSERAQLKLFQTLTGDDLVNEIVFLTVARVRKLDMSVPLLGIMGKRHNGCWSRLFANEEMQLAGHLADLEQGQPPAGVPLFRAPLPFVLLVVNQNWSTIAILDQSNSTGHGGRRQAVPWESLGFADAPAAGPTWVSEHVFAADENYYQRVADALRAGAGHCTSDGQRAELEKLVIVTQSLADDANPDEFARRVLSSGPSTDVKHRRVQPHYLLKLLLISTSVRNITVLPELLHDMCKLLFTDLTALQFNALLTAAGKLVLSKGAISRARLLLDGAFMRS